MIDFPKPIDPFKHVKIQKIGQEEEKEEKNLIQRPVTKKFFVYLSFFKILSNILKIFKNKKKAKTIYQTSIHRKLKSIKSLLESLKEKDLCQDTEYMNLFAFTWLKFLKDYEDYKLINDEIYKLMKKLISAINSYPEDSEFSLGYYISELAGYKWIPFPYMEILRNLHLEHSKNPENSHLKLWTDLLDEMLSKI